MVNIIGVPIYDDNLEKAVATVLQLSLSKYLKSNDPKCISTTGAHGLVYAKRHQEFANILESFYINLPDGMPGVWIGKLKGAKRMERCYGPNFFKEVIIASSERNIKHYLCGGKKGVAEELKKVCENRFKNHNIVGTYSPPFREITDEELDTLAKQINKLHVDIVWIGLSTPKQEIFASKLAKYSSVHFIITVGAAFDFHTGRVTQAPKLIQNIGMEWFFRLLIEPKRLYKRYFEIVPLFIYYNIRELMNYSSNKDN